MQALLNLPKPANNHSSLQTFYDTIENHVRGLSSLGKLPETYGSLLTPIILVTAPKCEEETERIAIPTRSINFGGVADSGLARCGAIRL